MNKFKISFITVVFLLVTVFLIAAVFLFIEKADAQTNATSQAPNVIYGWVKRADGTPMPDVQVWYCTSSVPEPFNICLAKELIKTNSSGRWLFMGPPKDVYIRIWATFPGFYSQAITDYYAGGAMWWGDLYVAGNPAPLKPVIRVLSPNGGEKFLPGSQIKVNWQTIGVTSETLVNIYLFRSSTNPESPSICDIEARCTESTYKWAANIAYKTANDGEEIWTVPKTLGLADDYFIRVLCYDSTGSGGCGTDDSDAPFSITDKIVSNIISVEPAQTQESIPASITKPYMEEVVVGIADGAKVVIPPSGAVLAGSVTVAIQPEIGAASFLEEIPLFLRSEVVSVIYDIIIKDEQGREVKELQKEIEITIPYKDEDLKKQGVAEDKIYPAYFDEAGDVWVKIENYTLDKEKNLALARIKHLTRFAIVAPADVSPPEAPTNKTAVALKDGSVKLSWVNPKRDFHHVKIYRSEVLYSKGGNFGQVAFNDLTGISILDKSVIGGKIYYYLIRSIDPAGNESENTVQLSVKTPVVVLKPGPSILEEEKVSPEPAKEIVLPAPAFSNELQVTPPAETQLPVEKPGFFLRLWQAIVRFIASFFD